MQDILSTAPHMRASLHDTLTKYTLDHITELDTIKLSPYDRLTLLRIIIGCCKNMDHDLRIKSLKTAARNMVNLSDRKLAFLSIMALSHQHNLESIRVSEMKSKLPNELRDMNLTSFFRVFRRSVEARIFTPSGKIKRKRGRRSPSGKNSNLPGPKSNYKQSQEMEDIIRVISIPSARKLIYLLLLESGLLFVDILYKTAIFLYALKMGGPDTIKKLLNCSFFPRREAFGDIDKLYGTIKDLNDDSLIRKADKMSVQYLVNLKVDNPMTYMSLVSDGLSYYEPSIF